MNPLHYSISRRRALAYFGLGLTAIPSLVALKGCTQAMIKPSPTIAAKSAPDRKALPEFTGVQEWLNSKPFTTANLIGNVVLIQIWTFACINCQRTLPYIVKWHEQYAKQGLKVIGIHTPEFPFERDVNQIKSSMNKHRISYPVAVDNQHKMWSAYDNEYWPHLFLADRQGIIQYDHIGEGAYDETERKIRQLLG